MAQIFLIITFYQCIGCVANYNRLFFYLLQAWEAASKAVQDEEAIKQKLCEDLSQLVYTSACCVSEWLLSYDFVLTLLSLIGSRKQYCTIF